MTYQDRRAYIEASGRDLTKYQKVEFSVYATIIGSPDDLHHPKSIVYTMDIQWIYNGFTLDLL